MDDADEAPANPAQQRNSAGGLERPQCCCASQPVPDKYAFQATNEQMDNASRKAPACGGP